MSDVFAQNRADRLVEWAASLLFAGLMGYACWMIGGAKMAAAGAMAAFMAGAAILDRVAASTSALPGFELEPFEAEAWRGEELLLDDPLPMPDRASRVVKLFSGDETRPGALVARIEDYLGREGGGAVRPAAAEVSAPMPDASAALHAALSNIRASLR